MKPLQSLLDEVANHSTFHNWAHLLNCYRQQEITTEEFQRLSDLAYKLYYEQEKGLSPEKVEKLMKWIEDNVYLQDIIKYDDPLKEDKVIYSLNYELLREKLQSLLSAPQPSELPNCGVCGNPVQDKDFTRDAEEIIVHRACNDTPPSKQVGEGEISENIGFLTNDNLEVLYDMAKGEQYTFKEFKQLIQSFFEDNQALASHRTPSITEKVLLQAVKYGYEYHQTTSFPEDNFEDNCKNNALQWIRSKNFSTPSISIEEAKEEETNFLKTFLEHYIKHQATYKKWSIEEIVKTWVEMRGKLRAILHAQHSTPVNDYEDKCMRCGRGADEHKAPAYLCPKEVLMFYKPTPFKPPSITIEGGVSKKQLIEFAEDIIYKVNCSQEFDLIKEAENFLAQHPTPSITIEEAKDQTAQKHGFENWADYIDKAVILKKEEIVIETLVNLLAQHSTPVTQEVEMLAVEFAEWIQNSNWIYGDFYNGLGWKTAEQDFNCTLTSTKKLYQIFSTQLPSTPAAGQEEKRSAPCPNCKEIEKQCGCLRNKCIKCGGPVGNITFTVCDNCWGQEEKK